LPENPLPNSIEVKVGRLEDADAVVDVANTMSGIERVRYYKETVEKIVKITDHMQVGILVLMAALVFISVVMVANTIKLTVVARKNEIEIMKYVGATNWFIRGPFLVEGIFLGIISSAISAGIVAFAYSRLVDAMGQSVFIMLGSPMVPVSFLTANLFWVFASLGVSIGACGSIISMRKFLDT
jgi:cell division transport system permease protein